jgi:hypothetical protein
VGLVVYKEESNCIHHDASIERWHRDRIARRAGDGGYQCGAPDLPQTGEALRSMVGDNSPGQGSPFRRCQRRIV